MVALRFVYRLLLALWLGSIFFFAVAVAPALFRVLPAVQSAAVVRQLIPFIDVYGLVAGPLLAVLAVVMEGRPKRRGWIRLGLLAGMCVAAAVSFFVLTGKMEALRAQAGEGISALAPGDPLRREFGRLHTASTGLMLVEALCGLGVLGLALREPAA